MIEQISRVASCRGNSGQTLPTDVWLISFFLDLKHLHLGYGTFLFAANLPFPSCFLLNLWSLHVNHFCFLQIKLNKSQCVQESK